MKDFDDGDFVILVVWIAMIALAVILVSGCAGRPSIVAKPLPVPVVTRCTDGAVPAWVPVPEPVLCRKGWQCYSTPDAANLVDDIVALREWSAKVSTLCGPAK